MKYLILILSTISLIACTEDRSEYIDTLETLQKNTQENLQTCQSQLEFYRTGNSGSTSHHGLESEETTTEIEQPSEPEYEEVEAYYLVDERTTCFEREVEPCGMTFSACKNDIVYRCMQNAKYKVQTEQRLVE